jgi:hypothetical protein
MLMTRGTPYTFESDSYLQSIEESAFSESGLQSIIIPSSVEILCKSCFERCRSLSSITFESDSHLQRIEEPAFDECSAFVRISECFLSGFRALMNGQLAARTASLN